MFTVLLLLLGLCTQGLCIIGGIGSTGLALDYKVYVYAGKQDCYYQYVFPQTTLYVGYQVLRGGDLTVGFHVRHPNGSVIQPFVLQPSTHFELPSADEGYYEVCFDNQHTKLGYRLVNMYIATFRMEEWSKYADEIEELHLTVVNFTSIITGVENQTHLMLRALHETRSFESLDFAVLEDNAFTVTYMSFLQCLVIVASSILQIFSVRTIFKWNN